ncbi:hypothetical protein [Marinitoga aeolica]|nr:hypothetical protein [Marinitoga aeolica]
MLFSEKNGYKPIKNSVQIESIDETLKHRLWNSMQLYFKDIEKNI